METEEILALLAFLITMAVLVSASIKDWKEREVPDIHWVVLSITGLALLIVYSVYTAEFRWEFILLAAGTLMIIIDILFEKDLGILLTVVYYIVAAVLFIVPLWGNMSEAIFIAWASIPLCTLIFVGMFFLNIVRGGADVKCLIALSIMLPIYPAFLGLPLIEVSNVEFSQIFVFSISALFIAAILTVPMIPYYAFKNAKEGNVSKKMFAGNKMEVSEAEEADVWPLEDVVDGKVEEIKIPEEKEIGAIYSRLKEAGQEKVWVTPMIPFIIFITVAAAILFVIGNPLFLIF